MSLFDISQLAGQHLAGEAATRKRLVTANDPTLNYITGTGDPTQSPLYGALLSKSREAISSTYDNAMYNTRSTAASRGFGYASPISQAGESSVRAQEAGALSEAPRTALLDTIQPELQATAQRTQEASLYHPEEWAKLAFDTEKQRSANKQALWGGIAKLAGGILGGPIGAGLAGKLFPPPSGADLSAGGAGG